MGAKLTAALATFAQLSLAPPEPAEVEASPAAETTEAPESTDASEPAPAPESDPVPVPWASPEDPSTTEPAPAPAPEAAPAPAPTPAAMPQSTQGGPCKRHEDCPSNQACDLTRHACMQAKAVAFNARQETVKLAVAAPIAVVIGGGFIGLGAWLVGPLAKDKREQARGPDVSEDEADGLRQDATTFTILGGTSIALGSMAAVGGLIGLAVLPVYVKRRKGAERRIEGPGGAGRIEVSAYADPMRAGFGVRGRF
jgi:hypothetical protein